MSVVNRRKFLAATAGAATLAAGVSRVSGAVAAPPPPPPSPLGSTGIVMSRVGQGTGMRGGKRQSNHTRLGFEKFVALLRHSYERGVTFFDMADLYGAHVYFREALRSIPRDKVAVLTKIWWRFDGLTEPVAEAYRKKTAATTLERFCHEMDTDYLDIVLLHCVTSSDWDTQLEPYMAALDDAKKKGQVRAVGVSCHDYGAMEKAADCPWVDVVLARINARGGPKYCMDGTTEEVVRVLRRMKQNGKAVIGMKIYGEGKLADEKDECIRFAQGLGLLDAMTIGAETPQQMDETLRLVGKYPAAKVG